LLTTPIGGRNPDTEILLPDVGTFDLELTLLFDPSGPHGELDAIFLVADEADENELIEITERAADSVHVNVGPLSEPRVLVLTESHYPGWRATVNGQPAEILRADDAFMAVALPAGSHEVVFEFRPGRVYAGIAVTSITFLTAIAALLLLSLRRKSL
jgi:hypothetical protein